MVDKFALDLKAAAFKNRHVRNAVRARFRRQLVEAKVVERHLANEIEVGGEISGIITAGYTVGVDKERHLATAITPRNVNESTVPDLRAAGPITE